MTRFLSLRYFSVIILVITLSCASCFCVRCDGIWPAVVGNGKITTISRDLDSFSEVEISGVGKLEIEMGAKSAISITADENLLPLIKTDVRSNRLIIETEKRVSSDHGLVFKVTTPDISLLDSSGAATVAISLNNQSLTVNQSGAGSVSLKGSTDSLQIDLSGAGKIDAESLMAKVVDAEISGVGSITLSVKERLNADVSGAGSITYSGDPVVTKSVSGVGSITKK